MRPLLEHPPTPSAPSSASSSGPALAARAAKALVRWSATGFTVVDDATLQRRRAACARCPHQIEATRHPTLYGLIADSEHPKVCGLCGCAIARKTKLTSEHCPAEDETRPGFTRWGEPVANGNARSPRGADTTIKR
jgi:hypothetical protein